MDGNLAVLNSNYLDNFTGGGTGGLTPCYPYYQTVCVSSPARPIKLTFAEVERLRRAAKADLALREILQKFTALIEVTVEL